MHRRDFLSTAAAAAVISNAKPADGGDRPVRNQPLRASYWGSQYYDDKEREQLMDVVNTQSPFRWYGKVQPLKVVTFEKEFAQRMGTRYALAVTSGTAALQCAVNALEIGFGDEVILPAWTWHSCYTAILFAGGLPVFAEIDESFNIDPADIEHRITSQTKAIMAVHLQGNPADLDRILPIARKHNLRVIEDCAQSVGASYKGRPVGSIGDIGIYSLQLNKTITAGEGGAVVTNDPVLFERASRFHDLGALRTPHKQIVGEERLSTFAGCNFRMSEFTGGVLLAQTRKIDRIIQDVRSNTRRVYEGVSDLPGIRLRRLPDPAGELGTGVYIDFQTKERRDRFIALMKAENVPASPPSGSAILPVQAYIENKVTIHPAWPTFHSERGKAIRYGAASCPRTIEIHDRFGGVLMDPTFTKRDTDDIVAAIRKVYPKVAA
ncbi:MAG TPA: DegT/DnrJ/EryC1/StrS family aminotransferase [Bryobacteraceae bacterium]|jgi:8-amino-3,8-dideoxy-alpha-D-manno-octulosonate transaminase